MRNKNILLADDDPMSLTLLTHQLQSKGFDVVTAENGQQAWDLLSANPDNFDVVIADRMMPKMHGLTLLERMHHDPRLAKLPLIMLTGMADHNEVVTAVKAGVYDFLVKPVEAELLLIVVQRALQESEQV